MLTSPLRRARETADLIAERLGLGAPVVDPRLVEIDYGTWEGLTQAEVRLRWPDELRRWKHTADPDSAAAPGGDYPGYPLVASGDLALVWFLGVLPLLIAFAWGWSRRPPSLDRLLTKEVRHATG